MSKPLSYIELERELTEAKELLKCAFDDLRDAEETIDGEWGSLRSYEELKKDDVVHYCTHTIEKFLEESYYKCADSIRLDWLADKDNHIGNVELPTEAVERNLSSLRDAIDYAMKMKVDYE